MTSYLIKSALCLGLLLAFYFLFLEKEKMHRFNRFYLLGIVLFSMVAPLYSIYVEPSYTETISYATAKTTQIATSSESISWQSVLLFTYILIASILGIRFIKNAIAILLKIISNPKVKLDNAVLVLVQDEILPHTFWNYIFINTNEYKNNQIEEELFTHELAHATQKHTLDILFLEIIQVLFWFNPFLIWLKRAVQLNHEFLADDTVVASHHNISYYQHLLLDKAAWNNKFYLASNLNYSLTKKRLLMMKQSNSKFRILLKKLAILPILAGTLFLFAERIEAQTKEIPVVTGKKQSESSATRSEMKEYTTLLEKSTQAKMFKFDDIQRMGAIYKRMSSKQKASVKNFYDLLPPPPPPIKVVEGKRKAVKNKKPSKPNKEVIHSKEVKKVKPHKEPKEEEEIVIEEVIEKMPKEIEEVEIVEEIIEETKENSEINIFEDPNVTFYINNKKVSKKKALRFEKENKSKIKSVEVIKKNGKGQVMITTF